MNSTKYQYERTMTSAAHVLPTTAVPVKKLIRGFSGDRPQQKRHEIPVGIQRQKRGEMFIILSDRPRLADGVCRACFCS